MEPTAPAASYEPSPLFLLVKAGLEKAGQGDLLDYIIARRELPKPIPYRHISAQLIALTGVDITEEAPRRWYLRYKESAEQFEAAAQV